MLKSVRLWEQLSSSTVSSPMASDEQAIIAENLPVQKRKGGRKPVIFMLRVFGIQFS